MKFLSILVLSALTWSALPAVSAQQVPGAAVPQGDELLPGILMPPVAKLEPADLAGMASGTKPAVLTLEQAYSLTLIRARNPGVPISLGAGNSLDSKILDEQARRAAPATSVDSATSFSRAGFVTLRPAFSRRSNTVTLWTRHEIKWHWRITWIGWSIS